MGEEVCKTWYIIFDSELNLELLLVIRYLDLDCDMSIPACGLMGFYFQILTIYIDRPRTSNVHEDCLQVVGTDTKATAMAQFIRDTACEHYTLSLVYGDQTMLQHHGLDGGSIAVSIYFGFPVIVAFLSGLARSCF
jgi:hypothetical protein